LVSIPGIATKAVPFGEKYKINLPLMPFEVEEQSLPLRPFKGLGGMVLINNPADGKLVMLAILSQAFFLISLGITPVCLLICRYPDI